jgi:hypothetical protein
VHGNRKPGVCVGALMELYLTSICPSVGAVRDLIEAFPCGKLQKFVSPVPYRGNF